MNARPHMIGKCVFEIDITHPNDELWLYEQVSTLANGVLLPIISDILDELGLPAHSRPAIDSIELDLGDLPKKHFDTALIAALKHQLTQQIRASITDAAPLQSTRP